MRKQRTNASQLRLRLLVKDTAAITQVSTYVLLRACNACAKFKGSDYCAAITHPPPHNLLVDLQRKSFFNVLKARLEKIIFVQGPDFLSLLSKLQNWTASEKNCDCTSFFRKKKLLSHFVHAVLFRKNCDSTIWCCHSFFSRVFPRGFAPKKTLTAPFFYKK